MAVCGSRIEFQEDTAYFLNEFQTALISLSICRNAFLHGAKYTAATDQNYRKPALKRVQTPTPVMFCDS